MRTMGTLRSHYGIFALIALTAFSGVDAATWTGTLPDGSSLQVDPRTHRAMRHYEGGATRMWDGAHRLHDGSVVIIRDGQAVPTEQMIETWESGRGPAPEFEQRYCEQLVRKVCGFHEECATQQACTLAKQLLRFERDEQRRAPITAGVRPQTESGIKCNEALSEASRFPVCGNARPGDALTPCRKLVDHVCGKAHQCRDSPACDPARQLLQMELEERLASADPDSVTATGQECEKAVDTPFFKACGQ